MPIIAYLALGLVAALIVRNQQQQQQPAIEYVPADEPLFEAFTEV